MVPHRRHGPFSVADTLFNKQLRRGHGVVENVFGIIKETFRELLMKSKLQVAFLPDIITCCAILYNVMLGQFHEEVEQLLQVLQNEGLDGQVVDKEPGPIDKGLLRGRLKTDGRSDGQTMAVGSSMTWMHCSIRYEVTLG